MNPVSLSFLQTSSGPARELQDFVHPEVALGCRSRSHRVGFIGSQDMQGCVIHLGKNGNRADAHLPAGAMIRTAISPRLAMKI